MAKRRQLVQTGGTWRSPVPSGTLGALQDVESLMSRVIEWRWN